MFILRSITEKRQEANTIIGDHYSIVLRDENYEEFQKTFKTCFTFDHVADLDSEANSVSKLCYGLIVTPQSILPLYKNEWYYIMTGEGKTFANISYK